MLGVLSSRRADVNVNVSELTERFHGKPCNVPEPPKFCHCGRALIVRDETAGFDSETGERRFVTTWRCPRTVGTFWRITLAFMVHDEYELNNLHDWYWRRREYR